MCGAGQVWVGAGELAGWGWEGVAATGEWGVDVGGCGQEPTSSTRA